jgi:hypothetical protein
MGVLDLGSPTPGGSAFPGFGDDDDEGGMFKSKAGQGAILGMLGDIGNVMDQRTAADQSNEMLQSKRRNNLRDQMFSFLAGGGGADNAAQAGNNEFANYWNQSKGFDASPEVVAASEHRGPGGGLGVYSGAEDYLQANKPEYEDVVQKASLLASLLGKAGTIGGTALGSVVGGPFGGMLGGKLGGMAGGALGNKIDK